MPNTEWTPATRYRHDADELAQIGRWLIIERISAAEFAHTQHGDGSVIALDYFRLADRLAQLADDAREFARTMGGPLP